MTWARRPALLVAAAAAVLLLASPVAGTDGGPSVTVEQTPVRAGGPVEVSGSCWRPTAGTSTERVHLRATLRGSSGTTTEGFDLAPAPAVQPADGSYWGTVTVPADAAAGTYLLTATCATADWVVPGGTATFVVGASDPAPATPATPRPGPARYTG